MNELILYFFFLLQNVLFALQFNYDVIIQNDIQFQPNDCDSINYSHCYYYSH